MHFLATVLIASASLKKSCLEAAACRLAGHFPTLLGEGDPSSGQTRQRRKLFFCASSYRRLVSENSVQMWIWKGKFHMLHFDSLEMILRTETGCTVAPRWTLSKSRPISMEGASMSQPNHRSESPFPAVGRIFVEFYLTFLSIQKWREWRKISPLPSLALQ